MRMTSLLDCHFCAISEYGPRTTRVCALAEYDHAGQRLPDASPYRLRDFPLTRRVLDEQITAVVNVDDPQADPAEVAELRREGDRSLLMVPLVVAGPQPRPARGGRPEALARVLAPGAAPRERHRRAGGGRHPERQALRRAAAQRRGHHPACARRCGADRRRAGTSARAAGGSDALSAVATAVCEALGAISCVASLAARAPARSAPARSPRRARRRPRRATPTSLVARDPSGRTDLTLAVTLAARLRARARSSCSTSSPRSPRAVAPALRPRRSCHPGAAADRRKPSRVCRRSVGTRIAAVCWHFRAS